MPAGISHGEAIFHTRSVRLHTRFNGLEGLLNLCGLIRYDLFTATQGSRVQHNDVARVKTKAGLGGEGLKYP